MFFEFFKLHFKQLKLKKLITTHYNQDGSPSYKLEWCGEMLNDNMVNLIKTPLHGNGDFRSEECVEILKEADIVATNPPFSLFIPFIQQLVEHNKKFVIIGNKNAIPTKDFFKLLQEEKVFVGYNAGNGSMQFTTEVGGSSLKSVPAYWYTNLDLDKTHEEIPLTKLYYGNESAYPKYENYDAIEVDDMRSIPKDYYGVMGVPITYMAQHCSEQFTIIEHHEPAISLDVLRQMPKFKEYKSRQVRVNGVLCQKKYHRIFIQRIPGKEIET
jgi:hypothetical protein